MRIREWIHRLFGVVRASRGDDDLEEELRAHVALAEERGYRATGASQAMEALRDQRGLPWLDDFVRDTRHALRSMRRSPAFTAVALVTLALGIGANAAVFTLLDAVLFKPLPVRDPGSLVLLGDASRSGVGVGQLGQSFVTYSYDLYTHLRDTQALDDLFAVQSSGGLVAVRRDGWAAARPAPAKFVSGNYFQALGVAPHIGRTLVPADDAHSAALVAIVSFGYWRDTLNADSSLIGNAIDVNGVPTVLAGVAPAAFHGETIEPDPPAFWFPIAAARTIEPQANVVDEPDRHWLYVLGRLRPDATIRDAEARLTNALHNWLRAREGSHLSDQQQATLVASRVDITSGRSGVPRLRQTQFQSMLQVLLGISAAVLLLACLNIAGLLIARGMSRRAERAVRLALGASRGRLVRQSLAESLTLAFAGGVAALLVGAAGATLLMALAFDGADVPIPTTPDVRVVMFTLALSCVAAALFGALPAIRTRADIAPSMKQARFRLGKALVIGQVALSLVVLAIAGSLAYGLNTIVRQPFGFEPDRVLIVSVDSTLARYDYRRLGSLYDQIESQLNALPGVASTGLSHYSPFHGCCWRFSMTVPGYTPRDGEDVAALLNRVSTRYFETIGTEVRQGRAFEDQDANSSRYVAVVNEAFANTYFPTGGPIGRRFRVDSQLADLEIVGVVEDAKYDTPNGPVEPMVFLPLLQMHPDQPIASGEYHSNFISTIEVRTAGEPAAIAGSVRRALADIDPGLPVLRVETLREHIGQRLSVERTAATLIAIFGVMALVLACVGLYGVQTYLVQRRTAEIGIRVALGAARASVLGSVMRETLTQAAIGIVLGLPAAFAATRLITMGDVPPATVGALIAATVLLVASLALAGFVPARRASRLDPALVLRAE